MTPVSATIITLNEADRIAEAIQALDFCDEIVVVDSGSTDQTREIANKHGARVLSRDWSGYADQKNFAADAARHDWILNVDADERPGPRLTTEILQWKSGPSEPSTVAYSMPQLSEYLGRWIRHSAWYPDRKVRLYDRGQSSWQGNFVHETLVPGGRVGTFEGDLLHYPFRSIEDHYRRVDRYTHLAAEAAESRGQRFSLARLAVGPPAAFVKSFLLGSGFLDGSRGLRIAYMSARYVFLRETRISR